MTDERGWNGLGRLRIGQEERALLDEVKDSPVNGNSTLVSGLTDGSRVARSVAVAVRSQFSRVPRPPLRWRFEKPAPDARAAPPEAHPETKLTRFERDGRTLLRMHGNASAGVGVDPVDPATDLLSVSLPVFIENKKWKTPMRFLCIGNGQVQLGWSSEKPDTLRVLIDGKWHDAGTMREEAWHTIGLAVSRAGLAVTVAGETREFPPPSGFSGRVYLGDGFPEKNCPPPVPLARRYQRPAHRGDPAMISTTKPTMRPDAPGLTRGSISRMAGLLVPVGCMLAATLVGCKPGGKMPVTCPP